jgi:hypothetical protein
MGALLTVVEDHRFDSGLPWRLSEKLEPVVMMGGRRRISMSMWTGMTPSKERGLSSSF